MWKASINYFHFISWMFEMKISDIRNNKTRVVAVGCDCSWWYFHFRQSWSLSVSTEDLTYCSAVEDFYLLPPRLSSSLWIHRKSDYFTIGSSILIRSHFATFQFWSGWSSSSPLLPSVYFESETQSVVLIDIRGNTWKIFILHAGNPNISVISSQ